MPTDGQDPPRGSTPALRGSDASLFGDGEDLRQVFHHLDAGVVAHDADTSIRVCNQRACDILGLTLDQLIGVTAPDPRWRFLRHDSTAMSLDEYPVNVILRTRRPLTDLVVGVCHPDREDPTWARCNGHPVFDDQGEITRVIITFIDITPQRVAEMERAELAIRLQHAAKMEAIGRLAGGIAHDFNNILTGILGYADMVKETLDEDHPARPWAAEILDSGERAADLIGQLLAFASKQIVEPRVIQPNRVLSRCHNMLRRLVGEDIELILVPGNDVRNVRADPSQIEQIMVNLAVNARDAMPSGGRVYIETATVELDGMVHAMLDGPVSGDFVVIAVSDDGIGMDTETRSRMFEPFFSTKGPGRGTGLGLATVYGIVTQNKGFITVYSEPAHGTTFKLYLPAVDEDAEHAPVRQRRPPRRATETILLVEDDPMVRELARKILDDRGYTVLEAADGEEALLLNRRFSGRIDLLLSDVVMPGLNGRELHERLKVTRPRLEALFMSGYTNNVIAHHGVLNEGTEFLQKPFTARSLLARVQELLDEP